MIENNSCNIPVLVPRLSLDEFQAMIDWLRDNIQSQYWSWDYPNINKYGSEYFTIWFTREQDAVLFSLRWA